MAIPLSTFVLNPRYAPYPRFGHVVETRDDGRLVVTDVQCSDPRCAAEHSHGTAVWEPEGLVDASAYQGQAGWEQGRDVSPRRS